MRPVECPLSLAGEAEQPPRDQDHHREGADREGVKAVQDAVHGMSPGVGVVVSAFAAGLGYPPAGADRPLRMVVKSIAIGSAVIVAAARWDGGS